MIRRLIIGLSLALCAVVGQAQTLTAPQLDTACTACKATAACNLPRIAGDTGQVMAWLNGARSPATPAWYTAAPSAAIEEAPSYTSYDTLAQGKRDSWMVLLRSPRDFTRQRVRSWVVDVWGNATAGSNAELVLQAATFSASNLQHALGGISRSTGSVSALDLAYPHQTPSSTADWLVAASCQ